MNIELDLTKKQEEFLKQFAERQDPDSLVIYSHDKLDRLINDNFDFLGIKKDEVKEFKNDIFDYYPERNIFKYGFLAIGFHTDNVER